MTTEQFTEMTEIKDKIEKSVLEITKQHPNWIVDIDFSIDLKQ